MPVKSKSDDHHKSNGEKLPIHGGKKLGGITRKNGRFPEKGTTPSLARDPHLLQTIQGDIASLGLVGEQDSGLLAYLTYSSRKLDDPLSIIIKGPSGYGEHHLFNKTQSDSVKMLWENWLAGTPAIRGESIVKALDLGTSRTLAAVFRNHEALGTMIIPTKTVIRAPTR